MITCLNNTVINNGNNNSSVGNGIFVESNTVFVTNETFLISNKGMIYLIILVYGSGGDGISISGAGYTTAGKNDISNNEGYCIALSNTDATKLFSNLCHAGSISLTVPNNQ